MEPVIELRNVSIDYQVFNKRIKSLKDLVTNPFTSQLFERKNVIRDLSLDIYPGDVLGIVGRNGAGKSTLLKAIAGIMPPTEGTITVRKKIAPMLSLGVGIESELTGYENVYLMASIMGYTKKQTDFMMQEIREFSELSDNVLKEPVKTYSTGMTSRLTFSIAVSEIPEILIVDEVLAVGDEGFLKKSMKRIEQIKDSGSTIIFVSHSLSNLQALCNRAICIEDCIVTCEGHVNDVVAYYKSLFATR